MSKAPSMPLFCGDYLSDTKHLTLEQHGAYLVLLMVTWRNNGQAIKDDPDLIARYLGCTRDRWLKKIRPTLEPMFDLGQGTWRSLKLEDQWAYVQAAIAVKRENGKKGGRPSSDKVEQNSQNLSNETASLIHQSSDANTLINNVSTKAVGLFSVGSSETNQPQPLPQESKKDSPLPPQGGKAVEGQGQESGKPPVAGPETNRTLFPVQETQVTTKKRRSGSRKERLKHFVPNPALDEDWNDFVAEYPDRDPVNPSKIGRMVFEETIEDGIDPSDLINGAMAYCRSVRRAGKEGTGSVKHYTTFLDMDEKFWEQCIKRELSRNGQRSGNVTQFPQKNSRQVAV